MKNRKHVEHISVRPKPVLRNEPLNAITPGNSTPHDQLQLRKQQYALTIMAVAAVLVIQFQNPWIPTSMRLIFVAAILLVMIRWSSAILLALIQLNLYLDEPHAPESDQQPAIIATSFLTILLLMAVSRLAAAQDLTGIRSMREVVGGLIQRLLNTDSRTSDDGSEPLVSVVSVFRTCTLTFALLTAAGFILLLFREDQSSIRTLGLIPTEYRLIQLGLLLFVLWIVSSILPSELNWRRLTQSEAGVYLRSLYLGWSHRDLRMIVRRRLRQHRRRARRNIRRYAKRPTSKLEDTRHVVSDP